MINFLKKNILLYLIIVSLTFSNITTLSLAITSKENNHENLPQEIQQHSPNNLQQELQKKYQNLQLKHGEIQNFEIVYDNYSVDEKSIIEYHVNKSLSHLKSRDSELEIVAAINDYLYQFFILKDILGKGGADFLKDGHSICGGHAVTMAEMLYSLGIKSKLAYLIGIPEQGAHSLLEVYFSDGSQGLFDSTFGVFWYNYDQHQPISIFTLAKKPQLSNLYLYKTIHNKRNTLQQPIQPFYSIKSNYKNRKNYREPYYDPYTSFLVRQGAGVGSGEHQVFVDISMPVDSVYGENYSQHKVDNSLPPWQKLSTLQDQTGQYISWLYMLGTIPSLGNNVAHIYQFNNLELGKKYELKIYYVKALDVSLSIKNIGAYLPDLQNNSTYFEDIENIEYSPENYKVKNITIPFISRKDNVKIIVSTRGYMILNALEFIESSID